MENVGKLYTHNDIGLNCKKKDVEVLRRAFYSTRYVLHEFYTTIIIPRYIECHSKELMLNIIEARELYGKNKII